jgi:hypothetical protein
MAQDVKQISKFRQIIAAAVAEGEAFMVQAQQMKDRGMKIMDMHPPRQRTSCAQGAPGRHP